MLIFCLHTYFGSFELMRSFRLKNCHEIREASEEPGEPGEDCIFVLSVIMRPKI